MIIELKVSQRNKQSSSSLNYEHRKFLKQFLCFHPNYEPSAHNWALHVILLHSSCEVVASDSIVALFYFEEW